MLDDFFESIFRPSENDFQQIRFAGDRFRYAATDVDLFQLAHAVSDLLSCDNYRVSRILLLEAELQDRQFPSGVYHQWMSETLSEETGEDQDFVLDVLLAVDECWETDEEDIIYGRLEHQTVQQELADQFLAFLNDSLKKRR